MIVLGLVNKSVALMGAIVFIKDPRPEIRAVMTCKFIELLIRS